LGSIFFVKKLSHKKIGEVPPSKTPLQVQGFFSMEDLVPSLLKNKSSVPRGLQQGCQMVYFHTINANFGTFWKALG
jgi:hypothetical protein